jgi:ferrous iron transport protein B
MNDLPMNRCITIALSGNPNSGKTTIFNNITGTRQKVGNWPGVTVEKKEGLIHRFGFDLKIIDLPGTYSLTPFSIEEIVARDYVLEARPDVVIDIIDASNLERSLYLATQLRELGRSKVMFALNMSDVARARGFKIDDAKLSELLDVPVVSTIGNKNEGVERLLEKAVELALSEKPPEIRRKVRYSQDIETAIAALDGLLQASMPPALDYDTRWTAIKLLENDSIVRKRVLEQAEGHAARIAAETDHLRQVLSQRFNDEPEIVMTDERYGFIAGIMKEVFAISSRQRVDISRNIDLVLTNRFTGFPIFLFFIWAMFQLTFTLGAYPMEGIEAGVAFLSVGVERLLPPSLLRDLLVDGILAGVGSVIVFLPNILILFFCIALFEDTGYMARSAFLMDKIMHLIGLHGKSFIPMLMGFGCNVPAIMAARTLESEKDRILTILITPFMSCSARLPVYIVLAGAFFEAHAGTLIFVVYLIGIVTAILMGRLFRSTLLRGADAPFVMELPPYRVPMLKSLMIHMWERSKMFLKKMTGVILVGSVLVWALSTFPRTVTYSRDYSAALEQVRVVYDQRLAAADSTARTQLIAERDARLRELRWSRKAEAAEKSLMGRLGKMVEPVFRPLGIDWRGGVALLTGFAAKEIVVSTMAVLYAVEDEASGDALGRALVSSGMTPLAALSMMIFVLLYVPCLATIATIRRETASMKWTVFSVAYMTGVAWLLAFAVFQGGRLLGFH